MIKFKDKNKTDILFYSFRYALGRRTFASMIMTETILDNWDVLKDWERKKFAEEILEYEKLYGNLGDKCDKDEWYKIVKKYY